MQYTIFVILAPVVAVLMVARALNIRQLNRTWLTRWLQAAIWMSVGFLVTNTLELAWPTERGTMLFAQLSYPFAALIPVFFFLFTLVYTGREGMIAGGRLAILFVIPVLTSAFALTEPHHGLIWASTSYAWHSGLLAMNVTYGWFFWVNTVYSVGILLASLLFLAWGNMQTDSAYRSQSLLAIAGVCMPLALFVIYTFKVFPGFTKNYSPIAYCVPALCFMAAIRQHGFLDLVPIARRTIVEEMADAMIAVDQRYRVMDLNEKARALLDLPQQAVGTFLRPGTTLREALASTLARNAHQEIALDFRGETLFFDARVTAVHGSRHRMMGSIALLHDVTETHRLLEEKTRLISELSEASAEITTLQGIIPICMCCKKVRDDSGYWHQVESYVSARSPAQFSHGLCPDCLKKYEQDIGG